jgi:hypothetical protein
MKYRIQSSNSTLGKQGDMIDEKDVPEGINLGALVAGGHLEPELSKTTKDKE